MHPTTQSDAAGLLARRGIAFEDLALLAEVGSTAHGTNVDGQDDLDLTAVRFEPWAEFVNGPEKRQSMMVRTQPAGVRSEPGDIDINVYTLRKFAALAIGGNPSILAVFYSPRQSVRDPIVPWDTLARLVASKRAGAAFEGYMYQQMLRWQGTGSKRVTRPELIEAYGFDTKYAGHIIRLGLQGIEYMETGRLTLPMDSGSAQLIRSIRTGLFEEAAVMDMAKTLKAELSEAIEASELPNVVERAKVESLLADVYAEHYQEGGAL